MKGTPRRAESSHVDSAVDSQIYEYEDSAHVSPITVSICSYSKHTPTRWGMRNFRMTRFVNFQVCACVCAHVPPGSTDPGPQPTCEAKGGQGP